MKDVDSIVKRYIDVWNETDAQRRRALIAEVFAEGAEYTDPLASVAGHEGRRGREPSGPGALAQGAWPPRRCAARRQYARRRVGRLARGWNDGLVD